MGAHKDLARAIGNHQAAERPGERLLVHMRMHKLAVSQTVARRIQHLPPIGIMIPPGILVADRHIDSPCHAGMLEGDAFDPGIVGHGGCAGPDQTGGHKNE